MVALQQGQALVEERGTLRGLVQQALLNGFRAGATRADEQHLGVAQLHQQAGQPFDLDLELLAFRRQGGQTGAALGKAAKRGARVAKHHPAGAELVEQGRRQAVARALGAGLHLGEPLPQVR